jgi:hypothetical protein
MPPPDSRIPRPPGWGGHGAKGHWSTGNEADYSLPADPRQARIIGHVFLEADGTLSITPTIRIRHEDEARLRAAVCKLGRWRSVTERLVAGWDRRR